MGDSHFTSNIVANPDYASLSMSGFNSISATSLAGALTGNTAGTHTGDVSVGAAGTITLGAGAHFLLSSNAFLAFGSLDTEASILALATSLVTSATPTGLYLDTTTPAFWIVTASNDATTFAIN
jgi:hypothetical protein